MRGTTGQGVGRSSAGRSTWRSGLGWGLAAAIVLAGCSSGRPDPAVSPRAQAQEGGMSRDLQSLRQENDALKQEQLQNARQIEALQKQLTTEKEEQRRFREMMATNFDLLEQSVALTLSKSIDGGGGGKPPATAQMTPATARPGTTSASAKTPSAGPAQVTAPGTDKPAAKEVTAPQEVDEPASHPAPAETKAPEALSQKTKPMAPMAVAALTPMALGTGKAQTGAAPSAAGQAKAQPAAATASKGAAKPMTAAAVVPQEPAFNDPDLTPPKHPKTLTANRAAKALYERGFALYANRQYDQAVLVYQNFLSRYPEDIYSDNAQFWIGESYLHMDKLAEAEGAYRKVLREYEHKNSLEGYKTPEAIYRLGTLAQKRDDARKARYYFAAVVQRFPESSASRKAQRDLEGKPKSTAQSDVEEDKAGG